MSVTIRLADDLDISRGDLICRPENQPEVSQDIDAMVCWMAERPLRAGAKLGIKHTTRTRAHWSRRCTTSSTSTRCTATRASTPYRSTASTE